MNDNYHTHNISIVIYQNLVLYQSNPMQQGPKDCKDFHPKTPFSTQPRNRWSLPTCWLHWEFQVGWTYGACQPTFEPPLRAASLPLFSMNKTPVFPDNMVFQETWSIELIGRLRPEIPGIPQEKHTKSPADSLLLTSSWRVYKPNRSINESTLQKTTVLSGLKWIIFHQPGFAWNNEISLP